jgi:uncharacterized protein YneF (UPF0154 family)
MTEIIIISVSCVIISFIVGYLIGYWNGWNKVISMMNKNDRIEV